MLLLLRSAIDLMVGNCLSIEYCKNKYPEQYAFKNGKNCQK